MRKKINLTNHQIIGVPPPLPNNLTYNAGADVIELKKRDSLRRDLISNVAHDLRTPLSSIRGYLETLLIKNTELDAEERFKFLQTILSSTIQLSNLIEELFELSRLEVGEIKPKPEPFSLMDLVQDVVLKFKPVAEKMKIRLTVDFSGEVPPVYADIGMIERVLSNLFDNGLRFTPSGGIVKISLEKRLNSVRVSVADTGCGIAPEDLPYVFDRYYHEKKATDSDKKGTGLGLAISKRILKLQHSCIQVESKIGFGTKFYFDLPVYDKYQREMLTLNKKGKRKS